MDAALYMLLGFFLFPALILALGITYVFWLAFKPRIAILRPDGVSPTEVGTRIYYIKGVVGTIADFSWAGPSFIGDFQVALGRLRRAERTGEVEVEPTTEFEKFAVAPGSSFEFHRNETSVDKRWVFTWARTRVVAGFFLMARWVKPNRNQREIDAYDAEERRKAEVRETEFQARHKERLAKAKEKADKAFQFNQARRETEEAQRLVQAARKEADETEAPAEDS